MTKRFFPVFTMASLALTSCAQNSSGVRSLDTPNVPNGRTLFLKNCAHCHGADARGDEGPDLHNLDWTDDQIITRIRNGKPRQMTAFVGKLPADQINEIKDYVRTLK
jgi:cytochrome c oxidase cbb3-type subunit 3